MKGLLLLLEEVLSEWMVSLSRTIGPKRHKKYVVVWRTGNNPWRLPEKVEPVTYEEALASLSPLDGIRVAIMNLRTGYIYE